jgi:hypothetical protein
MKHILWSEMKRSILNCTFLCILLFESMLVLYHHYFYSVEYVDDMQKYIFTASYRWIGFSGPGEFQFLLICMPIIAALPFSTSYIADKANDFRVPISKKISFRIYLLSKYVATFCSGGLIFVFPIIGSFVFCKILSPYGLPNSYIDVISMYICINFLFAGLIAVLGLGISTLIHKSYVAIISPFLLNIFLLIILVNTGASPIALCDPSQPVPELFPYLLLFEYIILLGGGLYMYTKGSKRDEKRYARRLQIKLRYKEIH